MSSIEARPAHSVAARAAVSAALLVAMLVFGIGVYHAAALFKGAQIEIRRPTATTTRALQGTMYVVQHGAIYRFERGSFHQITSEDGWMQPAISADGSRLVAVKRALNRSDLYVLRTTGQPILQLTHNQSATVEANHWVFYPRFGPDGSVVYFSYDAKDPYNSYRVDLAIFAASAENPASPRVRWTEPNQYTGGDVAPIPLQKGGLLYTKFSIDDQSNVHSQVWLQARRGSAGAALTKAADDCGQPAVSKDETLLAMVCRHGGLQAADLEIASLEGTTLGTPSVMVQGRLVASPAFSPDGKLLAYLAPAGDSGPFQLWTVAVGAAAEEAPRQITSNLDLDPISSPAWTSS